jgi:antitoxin component YwqK of YwqJK toxin-antitoxin module
LRAGWFENGQKSWEGNYEDGKVLSASVWKPDGEECPVTNLENGNGVVVNYKDDGTEEYRATLKDGEIVED